MDLLKLVLKKLQPLYINACESGSDTIWLRYCKCTN